MPKPNLRVAVVTTYPPSQGSLNEYAFHFVRCLCQKPEVSEVILLTDELPDGQSYNPAAVATKATLRIIPSWRFNDWRNAGRILQTIRKVRPDVVLFNLQFATFGSAKVPASLGLATPALVRAAGFPTIVLAHNIMETINLKQAGFDAHPFMEKVIRLAGRIFTYALLQANYVAFTIPKYVEILQKSYKATNVLLAPHGAFEETPQPSFELPDGPQQIMTFGKFGTYKRVETLVEAFQLLQNEPGRGPVELVIAGTDSPNAAGYLQAIREKYTDVPNIRFTGYVPEEAVPRIFGEAAVVVFPYTSTTGSSGVLHQAGEYGKAVVLPHLGDFAELIAEEGYTGQFFEPENPVRLADAIGEILDNPELRREIGMQNYMASSGLPISEVVDWYLLHFQELLKEKQPKLASRLKPGQKAL